VIKHRVVIAREGGRSSIPEAAVMESRGRSVLDTPHARGMTSCVKWRKTASTYTGFPVYGIDAVRPPSTGIAWPLT
jgi:hypothetical protein